MLNGIDPLIIIVLKQRGLLDIFAPTFLASAASFVEEHIGLPIPIYLSERGINRRIAGALGLGAIATPEQTGILVESESRSLDIETTVDGTTSFDLTSPGERQVEVMQNPLDSQATIHLVASRDSILLTVLLALMDMILKRAASREYEIHYINGPTCIFGARLHRFATSVSRNDDLVRIEMTLSTAAKRSNPLASAPKPSVPPSTEAVPLG